MAMQIMPGKINGKSISYEDGCKEINVTDVLRSICDDYFEEETVLEEDEEITIEVVHSDKIIPLSQRIETEIFSLLDKLQNAKGDTVRKEIVIDIKDLILFRSLIISALSIKDVVLTIS